MAGARLDARRRSPSRSASSRPPSKAYAEKFAPVERGRAAPLRARGDAAERSTRTGASTWPRSTTCARASTCAATRRSNPKQEYKREAFELFGAMLDSIKREVTRHLMAVQIRTQEQVEEAERRAEEAARAVKNVQYQHAVLSDLRRRRRVGAVRRRGRGRRRAGRSPSVHALHAEGRAQRSVSLRLGQEVQAVPRQAGIGTRVAIIRPPWP